MKIPSFFLSPVNFFLRFRRTRPIRFTRFGTFYILFSLAVGAAAINTGNNLLYLMLGLLLGFIIISGFLSDSCLWGLSLTWEPRGDFYAGQPAEFDLVAQKTWFPAVAVRLEATWQELGPKTKHLMFWIPRYGVERYSIQVQPPHRGWCALESLRLSTQFPFGLFEKSHTRSESKRWVVFPRVRMLPLDVLRAGGLLFSDQPTDRKGQGAIPFDVRPFQMGDSGKRIHWKSTAKHGEIMVTDMEEESGISQRVRVSRWIQGPPQEAFIAFVASLIYTLHRNGLRVGLEAPGARFNPDSSRSHLKQILTYLALVDPLIESAVGHSSQRLRSIDAVNLWNRIGPGLP